LWGIANQKYDVKACYEFIKDYWRDWFPKQPAYQNFNRRIGNLCDVFVAVASCLITESGIDPYVLEYIIDSMPVIVAGEKRSNSAKVASEFCNKGYCASKKMYYYGVKLHALVQKQYQKLPNLFAAWVTPASTADITSAEDNLDFIRDMTLFGDKAYISQSWAVELAQKNVTLVTPKKLKKGQTELDEGDNIINYVISSLRQPIESFFSWIQEKTNIQRASKVRSANGLFSFIFARIAACFLF
jgi:hypothetical protein